MIRGTTPKITYRIKSNVDFEKIKEIWITLKDYLDNEETFAFSKDEIDIDAEARTVTVALSQVETLALEDGKTRVQLRWLDENGEAYASNITELELKPILKDGVIDVDE